MKFLEKRSIGYGLLFLSCLFSVHTKAQGEDAMDYPYRPVPFTQVKFTDSFWLPRIETNRTVTIPFAFKKCEDTHRIEDFKVAAGLSTDTWKGPFGFNDSDVYKIIEGASYALMVHSDPQLDAYLDDLIHFIATAQEPDGYLYTAWTTRANEYTENIACSYKEKPWDNIEWSHELYNLGHMYEAATAHFQATGKKSFLDVAIKSADLVCEVFGPGRNEGIPGHQEIEIGLVKLYRITGQKKYLEQSEWFLDQRGRYEGIRAEYSQSHMPVVEQASAVGHAVRATYMYSGMADVAALTGNQAFLKAIDTLWNDVANKKLYITGGIGASAHGEAYGKEFELPNRIAYCETCAAIANVYWNHRMFLLHGESRYIDVMERTLYNCVISGVSLDGTSFFYQNPHESAAGQDRSPWFDCACCPGNLCRFIGSVPGYVYAVRDGAVYVNLFVDSRATFDVARSAVTFTQKTQYPWDGNIRITVDPDQDAEFDLCLRIPDWARGNLDSTDLYEIDGAVQAMPLIKVNGNAIEYETSKGYASIRRAWKKGDAVQIVLPMTVERIRCYERVADNIGKTAIQLGPLVYCIEHVDVEGGNVLSLVLDRNEKLTASYDADLLGGLMVIEGTATEVQINAGGEKQKLAKPFRAIPYYAWSHRGIGPMAIWIPYSEEYLKP